MEEVEILQKQLELTKEQNHLLKEQNQTLKDIYSFWTRIVSDEYFNEMMQQEGHRLPK